MKREEKNAQTRQRIVDAALEEFSQKGFEGASLNVVCAQNDLSKGIIYHYFKDKDELYLLCVGLCFDEMAGKLRAFGASDAVLPQAKDYAFWMFIAAYGVVQRLILIGCYVVMGFMQGYQPIASYAFGARNEERFHESVRFAIKGALVLTVLVAAAYILLAGQLILLFNRNPLVVEYGRMLLISQVALYPAFGLCYMMTITFQTIGSAKMGLLLSMIRQGIFYLPFILTLPGMLGVKGIYLSQPAADVLTILMCLLLIRPMKRIASRNMGAA